MKPRFRVVTDSQARSGWSRPCRLGLLFTVIVAGLAAPYHLPAREKDAVQYGAGLIVNVPLPEAEVTQVVQDVVQNGIIRGTKEYAKDEYVTGATTATSTKAFKEWTEGGKVFYKLRLKALDPQNFKNTNDVGTLAVRYVIQPQGDKNTVLHIDAVFVEDFRHVTHASNGSVEGAEYKDIHDRLDAIEAMKTETIEAEKEKQEQLSKKQKPVAVVKSPAIVAQTAPPQTAPPQPEPLQSPLANTPTDIPQSGPPSPPAQTLEERVQDLKRQVERLVKAPGAPLKSAPFHTASTLQSLPAGAEVLIVISTPYWYGVETHTGEHGWMLRDQLELVP
jgi:hypothetical protein